MEEDEKSLRVQKARELEFLRSMNRKIGWVIALLLINLIVMLFLSFILRIATFSAENKTDLRYYNLKRVIALTHDKWINEYTGEIFDNETDYNASEAKSFRSKRKSLFKKMFLFFSKD